MIIVFYFLHVHASSTVPMCFMTKILFQEGAEIFLFTSSSMLVLVSHVLLSSQTVVCF
jgi:hypothetical protein